MLTLRNKRSWVVVLGLVAVGVAAAQSGRFRSFREFLSPHQKAFFLDNPTVEFVRPGLNISVQAASIAADGTISATYKITDPQGLPLDSAGIATPGPVALSFVAAFIPQGQEQYTAYTTRVATGTLIPSTNQPGADTGGTTVNVGPGTYTYTFGTKAKNVDPAVTHTIGIYGSRNLTTFSLPTNFASTTYNFVPNGSAVVTTRDVVRDESCNRCHDQISFHGGSRRGVALCVMCHQPQNVDPTTGETADMKVMVHKLHSGSSLPSVVAGKKYAFAGRNGLTDFSDVVFPADVRRCQTCHDPASKAVQKSAWLTTPTRAVCGSCHDDVNFETGKGHPAGAYTNDAQCATCHVPAGEHDFDASISGAHVVPADSTLLSGITAVIMGVKNGAAGSKPVVTFTLKDKAGNGVAPNRLGTLSLTMTGPTDDYGLTGFGSDVTTPGYVTESGLTTASCAPDGSCSYNFTHAVPAGATGSFAIGMEARRTESILAGTPKEQSVTYGASNPVFYFSVDGSTVAPRRQVVALANCQQCHVKFTGIHGGLRNNTEYCVMCHNPANTDIARRPAAVNVADRALPPQGINFNLLVHRIHSGENIVADGAKNPYVVVGFGGTHNDFSDVLFPPFSPTGAAGDRRNCSMCHKGGSEQVLPTGKNQVLDPQSWISPAPAITAACSGCHVSKPAAAHMLTANTTLGEACQVCHGSGSDFSVAQEHAQY